MFHTKILHPKLKILFKINFGFNNNNFYKNFIPLVQIWSFTYGDFLISLFHFFIQVVFGVSFIELQVNYFSR